VLPPSTLAAGYSIMYAAAGAGYAATGSLAGALLKVVAPSTAILAGVGLTAVLTVTGWWGEVRRAGRVGRAARGVDVAVARSVKSGASKRSWP
jgi:hypothetical protein